MFTQTFLRVHAPFINPLLPSIPPTNLGEEPRLGGRLQPEVVELGKYGVTEKDLLVHQLEDPPMLYPSMLAQLNYPEYPMVAGILRKVNRPTYEEELLAQMARAGTPKGPDDLTDLFQGDNFWEVPGA